MPGPGMLIFHKERIVLLATPRTGSTSVERALLRRADICLANPPGLKHMRAQKFRNTMMRHIFRGRTNGVSLIAVMRHPEDWLGSWYRYRRRDALKGRPNSTQGMSFEAFVTAYLRDAPPPCASVGSQFRFLCDDAGHCLVDRLFDYRRLDQLYRFLSERLHVPLCPEHLNASAGAAPELGAKTRAALEHARSDDYGLYRRARRASERGATCS